MEWNEFVQPILEMLLQALLPVVIGFVAAWEKAMISKAKAELEASQFAFLIDLADVLVVAAEQSGLTGELKNVGAEKKAYVLAALEAAAAAKGIKIDAEALSAIIEAAVVAAFGFSEEAPAE